MTEKTIGDDILLTFTIPRGDPGPSAPNAYGVAYNGSTAFGIAVGALTVVPLPISPLAAGMVLTGDGFIIDTGGAYNISYGLHIETSVPMTIAVTVNGSEIAPSVLTYPDDLTDAEHMFLAALNPGNRVQVAVIGLDAAATDVVLRNFVGAIRNLQFASFF